MNWRDDFRDIDSPGMFFSVMGGLVLVVGGLLIAMAITSPLFTLGLAGFCVLSWLVGKALRRVVEEADPDKGQQG